MKGKEVFIVIQKPLPIFPRLMPKLNTPIRARKYPQKNKNMTFYLVSVYDPEEDKDKKIVIRAPECWEAEVTVQVRRKE